MSSSPSAVDFEQLTPAAPVEPAPSLAEAAQKARRLVAAAEAEAERIRGEAREAGHAEGFEEGRSEARESFAPTGAAMAEALAGVQALEADLADRVEAEAVDLAMHVAERVVAGTVAVEPGRVLDVVRGALRTIVERERVTLLVHPDDLDLMREGIAELTASLGGIEHLEVQEERRVGRGGAIIRTSFGEVDARIETKLSRAREAVEKELSA